MRRKGISLVLIYIFAGLGLVGGLVFAFAWSGGWFKAWEPDSLPGGEVADRFVSFEAPPVYVETNNERVFVQHLSVEEAVWEEIRFGMMRKDAYAVSSRASRGR